MRYSLPKAATAKKDVDTTWGKWGRGGGGGEGSPKIDEDAISILRDTKVSKKKIFFGRCPFAESARSKLKNIGFYWNGFSALLRLACDDFSNGRIVGNVQLLFGRKLRF